MEIERFPAGQFQHGPFYYQNHNNQIPTGQNHNLEDHARNQPSTLNNQHSNTPQFMNFRSVFPDQRFSSSLSSSSPACSPSSTISSPFLSPSPYISSPYISSPCSASVSDSSVTNRHEEVPTLSSIPSLYQLCLNYICQHFSLVLSSLPNSTKLSSSSFQYLPRELKREIFERLVRCRKLRDEHFDLLLQDGEVCSVRLDSCLGVSDTCISKLISNCRNVESLALDNCSSLTYKTLQTLLLSSSSSPGPGNNWCGLRSLSIQGSSTVLLSKSDLRKIQSKTKKSQQKPKNKNKRQSLLLRFERPENSSQNQNGSNNNPQSSHHNNNRRNRRLTTNNSLDMTNNEEENEVGSNNNHNQNGNHDNHETLNNSANNEDLVQQEHLETSERKRLKRLQQFNPDNFTNHHHSHHSFLPLHRFSQYNSPSLTMLSPLKWKNPFSKSRSSAPLSCFQQDHKTKTRPITSNEHEQEHDHEHEHVEHQDEREIILTESGHQLGLNNHNDDDDNDNDDNNGSSTRERKKVIKHGLQTLNLSKCEHLSSKMFYSLILKPAGQTLETIDLSYCSLLDSSCLRLLSKYCLSLKEINLSNCYQLSDRSLKSFLKSASTTLVALNIRGCRAITDLSFLPPLTSNFRSLELSALRRGVVNADVIRGLSDYCLSLEHLNLDNCSFSGRHLSSLVSNCSNITHLSLTCSSSLTDHPILSLPTSPVLTVLSLAGCPLISDAAIAHVVQAFPNLTSFNLSGNIGLTDLTLEAIAANLPFLRELDLAMCRRLTDRGILALANSSIQFERLFLYHCSSISDEGIIPLIQNNIRLATHLSFYLLGRLTPTSLSLLPTHCPHLIYLDLGGTQVTNEVLQQIANHCPQLEVVSVMSAPVNDWSLVELIANCNRLKKLNLNNIKALTNHLMFTLVRYSLSLEQLYLIGCSLIDEIGYMSVALKLTSLKLMKVSSAASISPAAIRSISQQNPNLQCVFV